MDKAAATWAIGAPDAVEMLVDQSVGQAVR
jgi:hypothetical protein